LNDIVINYFSNQIIENDNNETKLVSPGELLVSDLLRGGVLYNLVCLSFIIITKKFEVFLADWIDYRWL
jgi:hypothetical protein